MNQENGLQNGSDGSQWPAGEPDPDHTNQPPPEPQAPPAPPGPYQPPAQFQAPPEQPLPNPEQPVNLPPPHPAIGQSPPELPNQMPVNPNINPVLPQPPNRPPTPANAVSIVSIKPSKFPKKTPLFIGLILVLLAAGALAAFIFLSKPDTVSRVVAAVEGMTCERPDQRTGSNVPEFDIEFEGVIARCSWNEYQYEVITEEDLRALFETIAKLNAGTEGDLSQVCSNAALVATVQAAWPTAINAAAIEDSIFLSDTSEGTSQLLESLDGSGLSYQFFDIDYICSLV